MMKLENRPLGEVGLASSHEEELSSGLGFSALAHPRRHHHFHVHDHEQSMHRRKRDTEERMVGRVQAGRAHMDMTRSKDHETPREPCNYQADLFALFTDRPYPCSKQHIAGRRYHRAYWR